MQKRLKAHRPPGRRWIKRSDRIFLGFFLFLILATFVVSRLPRSSQSQSPQAPISASSSLSSASSSVSPSSVSQGGDGSMTASQLIDPSQATSNLNTNSATGQATDLQPKASQPSSEIGDEWLIGSNTGLLAWTDPRFTIGQNTQILTAWHGVLLIADLFLVLFIMINGIRIALGGAGFRYADALETLPRILLAFAAANLSQLFIANLLELNNDLCLAITTFAQNKGLVDTGGLTVLTLIESGVNLLIDLVGGIMGGIVSHFISIGKAFTEAALSLFAGSLVSFFISLTLMVLYLFVMIQLIIRIALINLLTILAPLGFACWALPQGAGQQLMRIWLNATFASIMVQFLQLTCYTFGLLLFSPISGLTHFIPIIGFLNFDTGVLFKLPIVWITLRIPGMVQNVATQTMGEGSRNTASMISQTVGAAVSVVSTAAIAVR